MNIRSVRSDDRAEWLRMLMELHPDSSKSDHVPGIDAFLNSIPLESLLPAAVFVCERSDAGLAGFLELSVRNYAEGCEGPCPYVESWYVDADMRGQGIARALMTAAEEWAHSRGYREMASDALLDNVRSHQAHAALGFEEVERTVHFRKGL